MNIDGVTYKIIEDKYPAENMGTQMWYTNSLRRGTVGIGADIELVISIGYLFLTGKLQSERVFSVSGNGVKERHHILGRIGMMVSDLCDVDDNNSNRIITGGVFTGRKIVYNDFLGLRDNRLVIIKEDLRRIPFVFFRLGFDKLTLSRTWASCLNANYMHDLSTSKNGEERSCIQCGYCINVCPVKLMPNMIMKASLNNDIEQMENLSIYDCIDCGLCTFICPSKIELHHKIKDGKRLLYKEG
jgi:Na+-transporting NADH:ubiquinone oxidoreductase subunit A